MKKIQNKTKKMMSVQNKYNNIPIEEIMRSLYVDGNKSAKYIANCLSISYATAISWLQQAGIYSRDLGIKE